MQYLLLIHTSEKRRTTLSEAEQHAEIKEYGAFGKEFAKFIEVSDNRCGEDRAGSRR